MGLGSLFRRRRKAAGDTAVTTAVVKPQAEEPLTPAQLAELQQAWSELAEAAKGTGAKSFHACSRNGKPWQEDLASVRSMAALLRRARDEDTTPGTQPAG